MWSVAVALMAFAVAVAQKWPGAPWWLLMASSALAAAGPQLLTGVRDARTRRRARGQVLRSAVQQIRGPDGQDLPLVEATDLETRVHRAVLAIPYVRRDAEEQVRRHVRVHQPVLLVGPSMVGKTRLAAEVVATECASLPVVIPDSKDALTRLDAEDAPPQNAVIWMDDVEDLITSGGITDGRLRRLVADGNVLVATIRAEEYDRLQPTSELRSPEWDVLGVFERVILGRELSSSEQERVEELINDAAIRERIQAVGIGEYVGAAYRIRECLDLGGSGVGGATGLGYALVLGAADWHRCGLTRPVPHALLLELASAHLDARGQVGLSQQDQTTEAFTWATREINPTVSLLEPAGNDTYTVYDYALEVIHSDQEPIPDQTWDLLFTHIDPDELIRLGIAADVLHERTDVASRAFRTAAETSHESASLAMYDLGILLRKHGDVPEARSAYHQAIDSGGEWAPRAAMGLADLEEDQGDVAAACAAYQHAMDSGHDEWAARAGYNRAGLELEQGNVATARATYRWVIDTDHWDMAPSAMIGLGMLERQQGDVVAARAAYRQAIDSGRGNASPEACGHLGILEAEQGNVAAARASFQQAIDADDALAAADAARGLGLLEQKQGDVAAARAAFQQAIDYDDGAASVFSAIFLGLLEQGQGDVAAAREALQQAIDSDHWNILTPRAAFNMGLLELEQGDVAAARAAFQHASDSGKDEWASNAAAALLEMDATSDRDNRYGGNGTTGLS